MRYISKLHAICNGQGRPVRLHLTAEQVSNFMGADVLLTDIPDKTEQSIGDRGYHSSRIRRALADRKTTACMPPRKNRNQSCLTTSICIKSAIRLKTCS
ncbi:transposase [Gluconobacter thailandicus]|uniref:transposase n=1 Tax=Gluconobacter thailandicus TaxID=257438 RepID=UPI0009B5DDF2